MSTHIAQLIATLDNIVTNFDKQNHLHPDASAHSTKSDNHDVNQVVSVVLKHKLLDIVPGRKHSSFKMISINPLRNSTKRLWTNE